MSKAKPAKRTAKKKIGGPFLVIAAICEKVLREKDNVQSLIRVFDRLNVQPFPGQTDPKIKAGATFTLVIGFKSGDFVGTKNVGIRVIGRKGAMQSVPVVFTGGEGGPVLVSEIALEVKRSELLWFDISLDEQPVTRVPLRIELLKESNVPGQEKT